MDIKRMSISILKSVLDEFKIENNINIIKEENNPIYIEVANNTPKSIIVVDSHNDYEINLFNKYILINNTIYKLNNEQMNKLNKLRNYINKNIGALEDIHPISSSYTTAYPHYIHGITFPNREVYVVGKIYSNGFISVNGYDEAEVDELPEIFKDYEKKYYIIIGGF